MAESLRDILYDIAEDNQEKYGLDLDAINGMLDRTASVYYPLLNQTYAKNIERPGVYGIEQLLETLRYLKLFSMFTTLSPHYENEISVRPVTVYDAIDGTHSKLGMDTKANTDGTTSYRPVAYAKTMGIGQRVDDGDVIGVLENATKRCSTLSQCLREDLMTLPFEDWGLYRWCAENHSILQWLAHLFKSFHADKNGRLVKNDNPRPRGGRGSTIDLRILKSLSKTDMDVKMILILKTNVDKNRVWNYYGVRSKDAKRKLLDMLAPYVYANSKTKITKFIEIAHVLEDGPVMDFDGKDLLSWIDERLNDSATPLPVMVEDVKYAVQDVDVRRRVERLAYDVGLFRHKSWMDKDAPYRETGGEYSYPFELNGDKAANLGFPRAGDRLACLMDSNGDLHTYYRYDEKGHGGDGSLREIDVDKGTAGIIDDFNFMISRFSRHLLKTMPYNDLDDHGRDHCMTAEDVVHLDDSWHKIAVMAETNPSLVRRLLLALTKIVYYVYDSAVIPIVDLAAMGEDKCRRLCTVMEQGRLLLLLQHLLTPRDKNYLYDRSSTGASEWNLSLDHSLDIDEEMDRWTAMPLMSKDAAAWAETKYGLNYELESVCLKLDSYSNEVILDHWYMWNEDKMKRILLKNEDFRSEPTSDGETHHSETFLEKKASSRVEGVKSYYKKWLVKENVSKSSNLAYTADGVSIDTTEDGSGDTFQDGDDEGLDAYRLDPRLDLVCTPHQNYNRTVVVVQISSIPYEIIEYVKTGRVPKTLTTNSIVKAQAIKIRKDLLDDKCEYAGEDRPLSADSMASDSVMANDDKRCVDIPKCFSTMKKNNCHKVVYRLNGDPLLSDERNAVIKTLYSRLAKALSSERYYAMAAELSDVLRQGAHKIWDREMA